MFSLIVQEVFEINRLGIIISGKWSGEGTISPGDRLVSDNLTLTVLSIYPPKPETLLMGFKVDCTLVQAMSLMDSTLEKEK